MTIDQARDRLTRAVGRVEAVLQKRAAVDRDLAAALEASRAENASLRATNAEISARLDSAIGRLKAALGDQA